MLKCVTVGNFGHDEPELAYLEGKIRHWDIAMIMAQGMTVTLYKGNDERDK